MDGWMEGARRMGWVGWLACVAGGGWLVGTWPGCMDVGSCASSVGLNEDGQQWVWAVLQNGDVWMCECLYVCVCVYVCLTLRALRSMSSRLQFTDWAILPRTNYTNNAHQLLSFLYHTRISTHSAHLPSSFITLPAAFRHSAGTINPGNWSWPPLTPRTNGDLPPHNTAHRTNTEATLLLHTLSSQLCPYGLL